MQTPPPDLSTDTVSAALREGWGVTVTHAAYAPVGYGSHHWVVFDAVGPRWFVSVDVPRPGDDTWFAGLGAALELALSARDAGLSFVVAPIRDGDGRAVRPLETGHALAVYPYLEGRSGSFDDRFHERDATRVTAMLAALHAVPAPVEAGTSRHLDLTLDGRADLEASIDQAGRTDVGSGPFAGRLRDALVRHAEDIHAAMAAHDRLVADAGPQDTRLVVTHGEPHAGNLLWTDGDLLLIDWDTAGLAPPERDLWLLAGRAGTWVLDAYEQATGTRPNQALLRRYALAWALDDVASFVVFLRDAQKETADTSWSWSALCGTLGQLADRAR